MCQCPLLPRRRLSRLSIIALREACRTCTDLGHQIHHTRIAVRRTEARQFRVSRSYRVGVAPPSDIANFFLADSGSRCRMDVGANDDAASAGSVTSSVLGSVSRAGRAPTDRRPEARSLPSARKSRAPDRCAQYAPSPCILLRSLEALWATRYALHRVSLAPAISTPQ